MTLGSFLVAAQATPGVASDGDIERPFDRAICADYLGPRDPSVCPDPAVAIDRSDRVQV